MENSKQGYRSYTPVSGNDSYLLRLINKNDMLVFGVAELSSLSEWGKDKIHNTLYSLEKKNLITRIRRNCYTITDMINENLFEIATESIKPSYISFWTALSYYGFTEQQPTLVQIVSTKQVEKLKFNAHRIQVTTYQPKRFYGYKKVGRFVIAEKEKALVDSLYQPDKCGGLEEFIKCLKHSWEYLNKKSFVEYLMRFGNKSLISRAGCLINILGLSNEEIIRRLEKHKAEGYIKLDPKGNRIIGYDHKWRVIVNMDTKKFMK